MPFLNQTNKKNDGSIGLTLSQKEQLKKMKLDVNKEMRYRNAT